MGASLAAGGCVRLTVQAYLVGLGGQTFTEYGGRVSWDNTGTA
jgi:hypothetical protein